MTTTDDIKRWVDLGKKQGATHLIVVCDTWDYRDYPVYVSKEQSLSEVKAKYRKNMQKIMEVIELNKQ